MNNAISILEVTPVLEPIFDQELLYKLAEDYYAEMEEEGEANVQNTSGVTICLTILKLERLEQERHVTFYVFQESDELYRKMDEQYRLILRNNSSGSEFWDQWNAMQVVLDAEAYLCSTTTFSV